MAKKGLGRGLESLIPKKTTKTKQQEEGGVKELSINNIEANPYQPRTMMDKETLNELASSIKQHGVIQPLVVSKIDDNKYQLLAGERRLRASKIAGLKRVPVVERSASEQEKLEIAIIENVQRKNLNPLEEAKSYQRLIDEFDMSQDQVARKVGKSRPSVANILRILTLPDKIQEAIDRGRITLGHAKIIMGLKSESEQIKLFESIIKNNLSIKDADKSKKKSGFVKRKIKIKTAKDAAYEDDLRQSLGARVDVQKKGKGGRIVISFFSEDELSEIVQNIIN